MTDELLAVLKPDIDTVSKYSLTEGTFQGVLKAAYVKAFDFVRHAYSISEDKADGSCFFTSSALRGIVEDLIVLAFLRQLSREDRDEVILIETGRAIQKTTEAQKAFFDENRPYQPILQMQLGTGRAESNDRRITEIVRQSGLWATGKKLPTIEQMANKVGLRHIYDYIYRITSDTVHFNPRIAFRSGWGTPDNVVFGTQQFCGYYLQYSQVYGAFLFILMSERFSKDLKLCADVLNVVGQIEKNLNDVLRWPEALTYEEMNTQSPGPFERLVLKIAHEQNWGDKSKS